MSRTPLNPEDFRLVGFRNPRALAVTRITNCGILDTPPTIQEHRDVLYEPARYAGPGDLVGGLASADGAPIADSLVRRRGDVFKSRLDGAEAIDHLDRAIWLGWTFHHFGHFLLESLSRMWALAEVDPLLPVVFHEPVADTYAGGRGVILDGMGLAKSRIVHLQRPTRIASLLVPSAAFELQWAAHPRFLEPLRALAEKYAGTEPQTDQPVYLSRSRLKRGRRIAGEDAFEAILAENGFLVVHPETLTIPEQIRVVNRHRHIFAANGSAAHLVIFCLRNPHLHLLTQERLSQDFFLCSAVAEVPTTMVYCLDIIDPAANGGAEYAVNMEAALQYLSEEGFLSNLTRRQA